ncbi:MAG TPA: PepSY domain-containing protein, partial [Thermoanaerobaculia bacterium]|nr:PepSY domain-containing protein [Thermoanaerobaculia bacterium]HQP85614.1 PepSY domain-containing protein [Thermoanaerobaculia bacterium]
STFGWADRSAGTRARVLIRFLHTGEALGWPGRIVAVAASALSLVLVYTGFTLSWARFRRWRARRRRDLPASEEVRAAF